MGPHTLEAPKDLIIKGNSPHIKSLSRRMTKEERSDMRSNQDRPVTVIHGYNQTYGKFSRGQPGLKKTQEYPVGFAAANALAFLEAGTVDLRKQMEPGHPLDFDDDIEIPGLADAQEDPYLADLYTNDDKYWKPAFFRDVKLKLASQA